MPALTGLFAPHWRDDARGTIVGLSTVFGNATCTVTHTCVCARARRWVSPLATCWCHQHRRQPSSAGDTAPCLRATTSCAPTAPATSALGLRLAPSTSAPGLTCWREHCALEGGGAASRMPAGRVACHVPGRASRAMRDHSLRAATSVRCSSARRRTSHARYSRQSASKRRRCEAVATCMYPRRHGWPRVTQPPVLAHVRTHTDVHARLDAPKHASAHTHGSPPRIGRRGESLAPHCRWVWV